MSGAQHREARRSYQPLVCGSCNSCVVRERFVERRAPFSLGEGAAAKKLRCWSIHQKYPSRFFFSIEEASSESMRRPWRSEVVDLRISAMMSRSVSASDSIAPLSG